MRFLRLHRRGLHFALRLCLCGLAQIHRHKHWRIHLRRCNKEVAVCFLFRRDFDLVKSHHRRNAVTKFFRVIFLKIELRTLCNGDKPKVNTKQRLFDQASFNRAGLFGFRGGRRRGA